MNEENKIDYIPSNSIEVENRRLELVKTEYDSFLADYSLVETKASFAAIILVAIIPLIVAAFEQYQNTTELSHWCFAFLIISSLLFIASCTFIVLTIASYKLNKITATSFNSDEVVNRGEKDSNSPFCDTEP